jgi:hypothetical protein
MTQEGGQPMLRQAKIRESSGIIEKYYNSDYPCSGTAQ